MRLVVLLTISLGAAICCKVVEPSVKDAVKRAQIVFQGTISEISDSEIIFHVERVWKGRVPARFSIPKITWSETPCMPGFFVGHVKRGAKLLVYARRVPEFNITGYVPTPGSRTALVEYATEDLRMLSPGHSPNNGW